MVISVRNQLASFSAAHAVATLSATFGRSAIMCLTLARSPAHVIFAAVSSSSAAWFLHQRRQLPFAKTVQFMLYERSNHQYFAQIMRERIFGYGRCASEDIAGVQVLQRSSSFSRSLTQMQFRNLSDIGIKRRTRWCFSSYSDYHV